MLVHDEEVEEEDGDDSEDHALEVGVLVARDK